MLNRSNQEKIKEYRKDLGISNRTIGGKEMELSRQLEELEDQSTSLKVESFHEISDAVDGNSSDTDTETIIDFSASLSLNRSSNSNSNLFCRSLDMNM